MKRLKIHGLIVGAMLMTGWGESMLWADEPAPAAVQAPVKETEHLDFAQGLLSRGMYPMAVTEYQKFLELYPQSVYADEAMLAVGEAYFQMEDIPKALESFAQLKKTYPQSPKLPAAILRTAQIQVRQKNFDEALKELTSVDMRNSLHGQQLQSFYFYAAKAHRGKGNVSAALADFQKAFDTPDASTYTVFALMEYGELQVQSGYYKEAGDAFERAIQIAADKNLRGYLLYKRAETLFMAGKYDEAIAGFQEVLGQYPKLKVVKDALANMLLALFNKGKYDDVLAEYQKNASVIKEDGSYFHVHFAAVRAYVELQKYDEALALMQKILLYPNMQDKEKNTVLLKQADILIRQKKFEEGLGLANQVNAVGQTESEDLSFLKAQGHFGLGNYDKAFNLFQEVEQKASNSNFARASLLGMAHAANQAGKYKEAGDLFFKYYNQSQDEALKGEALYYTALMEMKLGALDQASTLAQKYIKSFPQGQYYEQCILMLADLYAKAKQSDQAIALLNEYVKSGAQLKRPDTVQFLLGYNMQALGQTDAALEQYAKVALNKDDPHFYASALKNSAIIQIAAKKYPEAAATFDRLISELETNHLEIKTYLWVFNQYLKEQKYEGILRLAPKAEQFFPGQGVNELAYFKAEAYRGQKDYDNALKLYDTVLSSGTKTIYTATSYIGKGLCLVQLKQFNEAKAEFQKAIDADAEDNTITLRARYETANAASQQENYDEALRFYLLVSTIYEDDKYGPESLWRAGEILEKLNRKDEADKVYKELVDKYAQSPQAELARKKVGGGQ